MFVGPLTGYFQLGINVTEPQPWGYPYPMLMPVFAPFGALAGLTFWRFAKLEKALGDEAQRRCDGVNHDPSPSRLARDFNIHQSTSSCNENVRHPVNAG